MYWLFVWWMEDISLVALNSYMMNTLPIIQLQQPLPVWLLGILSFFMPRVLRHFVPLIVGIYVARWAAVGLVQRLYSLKTRNQATSFLNRLQNPNRTGEPPLLLHTQQLDNARRDFIRLRIGGPGKIAMHAGHVAVTEVNGQFYRVLGAGVHPLERFEYVRAVMDLRPQQREAKDIQLITKDNVAISADISITYRIATGGQPATTRNPYPFDPDSVRRLAYVETNVAADRVTRWESTAIGAARGALSKAVRAHRLDELHFDSVQGSEPYMAIRRATERGARDSLLDNGIDLLRVRITRMELPPEVAEQYKTYWRTQVGTQGYLALADGQAEVMQELKVAEIEAELTMIQAIIEGVERAQQDGRAAHLNELVAVRLVEALENLARQSQERTTLPDQMLPQLKELQSRLNDSAETDDPTVELPE